MDQDAFIRRMREWRHRGKLLQEWTRDDYGSYFHEVMRPGAAVTPEMVFVLGCYIGVTADASGVPALFAWVGEDELGGGAIGLKQGIVPAGCIPLVATAREKIDRPDLHAQLRAQVARYRKPICLVRFASVETLVVLEPQ